MRRTLDTRQISTTISIATLSLDPEHLLVKDGSGRMGVTFGSRLQLSNVHYLQLHEISLVMSSVYNKPSKV